MKLSTKIELFIIFIVLIGCSPKQKTYNIGVSPTSKVTEYRTIKDITDKYSKFSDNKIQFKLNYGVDYTFEKNTTNLFKKNDDFAIIYNDTYNGNAEKNEKTKNIRTVLPISSKFLYIIHKKSLTFNNIEELFEGRKVAILSYDRKMILDALNDLGVDTTKMNIIKTQFDYSILDTNIKIDSLDYYNNYKKLAEMPYDIEVSFTPVNFYSKSRLTRFLKKHEDFTFFTLDDYKLYRQGSFVDGFCMKNKYYSPHIIPKGLFGNEPQNPILTIRQDLILITKDNVESEVVFDLVKFAIEKSGKIDMTLFGTNFENLNPAFPYHEGTLIFLNKAEPSLFERYGNKIVKYATGIGAFNTLIIYFFLWRKKRRKKELNNHYLKLLDYKEKFHNSEKRADLDKLYSEIRIIQIDMANQIKNEKIIVDENIRIINDLIQNLEDYYYLKINNLN